MADEHGDRPEVTRGARRIIVAVALCCVVMVGLAVWVFLGSYSSSVSNGTGGTMACGSDVYWVHGPEGEQKRAEFDESCDEARSSRRTTALIIGAGVATAAFAASTWPSRRLTGEELGPIR